MGKCIKKIIFLLLIFAVFRALSYAGIVTQGGVTSSSFTMTTNPVAGYVLTCDGSGNGTWQAAGSGLLNSTNTWTAPNTWKSSATFQNGSFSVGGSTFVINNGYIGISTSAPTQKLDIENSSVNNGIKIGNAGGSYGTIFDDGNFHIEGSGNNENFWINGLTNNNTWIDSGGGNTLINAYGKGNIGIGTPTPTTLLHISSGTLTIDGSPSGIVNTYGIKTSTIQITNGAVSGFVLTSDASGNATWQSAGVNLFNSTNTWTAPNTWTSSATFRNGSFSVGTSTFVVTNGTVGIGTGSTNENLTLSGRASFAETTSPTATTGYGKVYAKSSDSQLWFMDDGGVEAQLSHEYVIYEDQEASGTNGGSSVAGWQTRVLNTTVASKGSWFSLSTNQITLSSGTYLVIASAPAGNSVGAHKIRLRNVGGAGTTLAYGTSENVSVTTSRSFIHSIITLASSATVELQHYCATAKTNTGLGLPCSSGEPEVYADIFIKKMR